MYSIRVLTFLLRSRQRIFTLVTNFNCFDFLNDVRVHGFAYGVHALIFVSNGEMCPTQLLLILVGFSPNALFFLLNVYFNIFFVPVNHILIDAWFYIQRIQA